MCSEWVEELLEEEPWPELIFCELEVVVEAVSVLFAQELRKRTEAAQTMDVMINFFIGL